ncbi:MAG TPA: SAM-dependent chlorinase/fluorinase [Chloroflexia bacterium]|jgi:hypothetical protein
MGIDVYGNLLAGLEERLHRIEHPPVITLTTDFGTHDGYVGAMRGVIHTLLPDAKVVDISHDITPQQIQEGAFILYRAYRYFPASAVHIAVVDPGVGSSRRSIVLSTRHGTFVGPDNGIFTYVLRAEQAPVPDPEVDRMPWIGGMWGVAPNWAGNLELAEGEAGGSARDPVAGEVLEDDPYAHPGDLPHAYHLDNPDYWLANVSNTFHGRDVFAPVAAHLASGAHPDRMATPVDVDTLVTLPDAAPRVQKSRQGTTIVGQVIHIDRFGNIITNLPDRLLEPLLEATGATALIEIAGYSIKGLGQSYADVRRGQALALIGSERLLEVAVRNASAAQRMKVSVGDQVRIVVQGS